MLPNNDFWQIEQNNLWDAMGGSVLGALAAGAAAGEAMLPKALQPLANEEYFNAAAMRYLRLYQLRNVQGITDTTRIKASEIIQRWLMSGDSLQSLEVQLSVLFGSRRASQIAVTEVTRLFAQGNIMLWQSVGVVTSKIWRTARDEIVCPLCGPLDGTVVALEADFTQSTEMIANSDQMKVLLGARYNQELANRRANNFIKWNNASVEAPPRHVNCRCWIQPVVSVQAYEDLPIG